MTSPVIVGNIDVALLALILFAGFFLGLVFYLRREDRREGYPLEDTVSGRLESGGGMLMFAPTKSFLLPFGRGTVTAPTKGREPVDLPNARRFDRFPGAPYEPIGNPLTAGVGPGAYAQRADLPDLDWEGQPRIVPISMIDTIVVSKRDVDPRGLPVVGIDGNVAGTVTDLWVDRADHLIRYHQVELDGGMGTVLLPFVMTRVHGRPSRVTTDAVTAAQFAGAPRTASMGQITFLEEEKIQAYFGAGYLYATPARSEPLL